MGSCISRPETTEPIVIDMPKKKPAKGEEKPNRAAAGQDGEVNENSVANNNEDIPEAAGEGEDDQEEDGQANQNGEPVTDINDVEFIVANYPEGENEVQYWTLQPESDEYIITAVHLYNFYDDEQDVDYFNGIGLEYTHPTTRKVYNQWLYGSEVSNRVITYEVSNLDYINGLVWSQSDTVDNFMTHFGVMSKMGPVQEVGLKGNARKVCRPDESEGLRMLYGLEIGQSTQGRQFFVKVNPIWVDVPESKLLNVESSNNSSFLKDPKSLNTELLNKQMYYPYKQSNEVFSEFEALIDHEHRSEEYLGALPKKFISPEDQKRLDNMLKDCKAPNLIKQLKQKSKFHKQTLSADLKKEIVNVCIALITKELRAGNGLESVSENIRFLNKIFSAIYNDDHGIWDEVKKAVDTSNKEFNTLIFKEAIDQMVADPNMAAIQAEPDYQDPAFKGQNQKACPQPVDEAGYTEASDIINQYIHEAKQIIMEFHVTMRKLFGSHYIGAPVKGFNRIKAKVEEYMEEEKLNASDAVAKVMDFVRGTVVSYNGEELQQSLATLRGHKQFKIVRIKNGFKDLQKEAFKSILINIMAYNCMICEVQLTLKPMKTFNEISHFIYEIQREESLYNMVANHLGINQQFKSWLEPFIPNGRKLPLPERDVRWKGYIEGGQPANPVNMGNMFFNLATDVLGFATQSGTGAYLDIKLQFTRDGRIIGSQDEPRIGVNHFCKIVGTHQDYKTVEFTLYGQVTNTFKGKFIDTSIIEGTIGQGNFFRLYIGDVNYPSLSAIAVDADFSKIRKINIPDEGVNWAGYSYDIQFPKTKVPMKFMMRMSGNNGIGFGTLGNEQISITGKHENYRTFSFETQLVGYSRFYDGVFINNYTVKGKYNQKGEMGNFEIHITDPKILAILDPHNTRNAGQNAPVHEEPVQQAIASDLDMFANL